MPLRPNLPLLLIVATSAIATAAPPATWPVSTLAVAHSAIALMPEGTPADFDVFRPLHPTVVAWGEDGLSALEGSGGRAALDRKDREYRQLGVTALATNVWMLTATERYLHDHPDLADTACVDLWGTKIVPPWLADADYQGTKPWWGCTNQPRYQEHLIERLRAGLSAGATLVHLDDHSGTLACASGAGGCFCSYCLSGFRAWLKESIASDKLAAAGVTDVDRFDYRAFLLARHYRDRTTFIAETWKGQVPLWNWFLAYQREAAHRFIERLQYEAATIAGHPVPFGVNAYNLAPKQLFDADLAGYFANEVQHLDEEDTIPPVVYRLGEALGRPTFATATGEDWVAYRSTHATQRVRGWIAEAYAFGQYFMYAWNKWGFSQQTGTVWTQVDPAVFQPMCDFVRTHAAWLDGHDNIGATGLLYDNATADRNKWDVRAASRRLLDAGIPYRLIVHGDDYLRVTLTPAALASVRTLVLPSDVTPGANLNAELATWQQHGGHLVHATESGTFDPGAPDRIAITAAGRIWALPRVQRRDSHRGNANATRGTQDVAIHLLNRDYAAATDTFAPKREVKLTLDPGAFGFSAVEQIRYGRPGASDEVLPVTTDAAGKLTITVPVLEIWGIVDIRGSAR